MEYQLVFRKRRFGRLLRNLPNTGVFLPLCARLTLHRRGDRELNYELRITNYELRITNYESRFTNYDGSVFFGQSPRNGMIAACLRHRKPLARRSSLLQ